MAIGSTSLYIDDKFITDTDCQKPFGDFLPVLSEPGKIFLGYFDAEGNEYTSESLTPSGVIKLYTKWEDIPVYIYLEEKQLIGLADTVREKTGKTDSMNVQEMKEAVSSIPISKNVTVNVQVPHEGQFFYSYYNENGELTSGVMDLLDATTIYTAQVAKGSVTGTHSIFDQQSNTWGTEPLGSYYCNPETYEAIIFYKIVEDNANIRFFQSQTFPPAPEGHPI